MNERIRELVKQAGGDFWQRLENDVLVKDAYITFDPPENLAKFAELIVRETLDQVAEFSRLTKAYQSQGIDPEIDITKEVLKNFGFTRFPRS